jgi:hypothetical protein
MINCQQCGGRMWPRGSRKRCTPCAQGWAEELRRTVIVVHEKAKRIQRVAAVRETCEQRGARERAEKAARLAIIRAQNTAKQRKAWGLV